MKNSVYKLGTLEKDVFQLSFWAKKLKKLGASPKDIENIYHSLRKSFIELSTAISYIEQNQFNKKFDFYWYRETLFDELVDLKFKISYKYHKYFCFYCDWKEIPETKILHNF